MTKDEVLAEIRNHSGEMRTIVAALEYEVLAVVSGYRPESPDQMESLKGMMDSLIGKADKVKDILDQWPVSQ